MNLSDVQKITSLPKTKLNSKYDASEKSSGDFSKNMKNTKTLDDIFEIASKKYDVPKSLLEAIAMQESSFDPKATSHSGAQGIMQLMPATSKNYGVDDPYDPYQNIMGGAQCISEHLKSYNGDVKLALAAYNAGAGNVKKYGGIQPFEETKEYVKKVLNYYKNGVSVPDAAYPITDDEKSVSDSARIDTAKDYIVSDSQNTQDTVLSLKLAIDHFSANAVRNDKSEELFTAASNLSNYIDEAFTYDDYMKFIDIYTKLTSENEMPDISSTASSASNMLKGRLNPYAFVSMASAVGSQSTANAIFENYQNVRQVNAVYQMLNSKLKDE